MPDFAAWSPEDWSALAEWVTAAVAIVAGGFALQQVREARKLREEQSQPYVVAFMEPSAASEHLIDLVVRNFGATAALGVKVQVTPQPERSKDGGGGVEGVRLFDELPVLVPGQEWRTSWDFGPDRKKADLPDRHTAVITYRDSRGHDLPQTESVLDWGVYRSRKWIVLYGIHDAAKALREIKTMMAKWQENIHGSLSVYVRSGDAKDEKQQREIEDFRREKDETSATKEDGS